MNKEKAGYIITTAALAGLTILWAYAVMLHMAA